MSMLEVVMGDRGQSVAHVVRQEAEEGRNGNVCSCGSVLFLGFTHRAST